MTSRIHNGIQFQVWSSGRTWFWLTVNNDRGAGAIGVAASEAEATNEARRSISELFGCDSISQPKRDQGRQRRLVCN